jgi:hypothetical protein
VFAGGFRALFFEIGFFVLCVLVRAASIRSSVHRFGNRCKTFFFALVAT